MSTDCLPLNTEPSLAASVPGHEPQIPSTLHVSCHSPGAGAIWPVSVDSLAADGSIARRISTLSKCTRRWAGGAAFVQPMKICFATITRWPGGAFTLAVTTPHAPPRGANCTLGALTLPRSTMRHVSLPRGVPAAHSLSSYG